MQHPYNYSIDKTLKHRLLDFGVPLGLFLLFFFFYNFGKFNAHEIIKTSGLLSITLLGITLAVGPLARLTPALDILKAHRKVWGILSFLVAFIHVGLVFVYFYKFNFLKLIYGHFIRTFGSGYFISSNHYFLSKSLNQTFSQNMENHPNQLIFSHGAGSISLLFNGTGKRSFGYKKTFGSNNFCFLHFGYSFKDSYFTASC